MRELDMLCADCGVDTDDIHEFYMVNDELWLQAVPIQKENESRVLCVGCLERRIGRQLTSKDFTDAPVNRNDIYSSRLYKRLTASP